MGQEAAVPWVQGSSYSGGLAAQYVHVVGKTVLYTSKLLGGGMLYFATNKYSSVHKNKMKITKTHSNSYL